MDILISYDNQELFLSLAGGESAGLYGVPAEYSEDGPYLAQWGAGELEPLPACETRTPLLRLRFVSGEDGANSLVEDFKAEGVSYAQN